MLPSFVQTADAVSGCNAAGCFNDDGDFEIYPIVVTPPVDDPWDPWGNPDPNPPTCDYLGDPDCDEGDDGGGSTGGSNGNEDEQACLAWYALKDEECLLDPVDQFHADWDPFGSSFHNLFNWSFIPGLPSGGFPDFGAPLQVYQNIIVSVARAYWVDQTEASISQAYWDAVDVFCIGFPLETTFSADRAQCYNRAYSVSLRLIPSFSDHAFTISQVERWGITVQHLNSGNPFANWAANFLGDINKVKQCKIWFDGKEQIPGCE